MIRPLTARERDVLALMLNRADTGPTDAPVPHQRRETWLTRVPSTFVGGACECGTCPSIELVDEHGRPPTEDRERLVLTAETTGALLHLFIDDDRPSYLELAPLADERPFGQFPDPVDITC